MGLAHARRARQKQKLINTVDLVEFQVEVLESFQFQFRKKTKTTKIKSQKLKVHSIHREQSQSTEGECQCHVINEGLKKTKVLR